MRQSYPVDATAQVGFVLALLAVTALAVIATLVDAAVRDWRKRYPHRTQRIADQAVVIAEGAIARMSHEDCRERT